ncbi:MAG: TetR/AcrR family transcriptional regulator [Deltaproteobacteria bacterium]|nr:TetR/AcrR family transcriptional regulator [Deltaproteobacteria bacterium]
MARPRSDIAPRIVQAARRRFLEHGVDGASLRRIASDAGTSIGMVYYYFPTKDDLFFAVVEETYSRLVADLAKALAPGASFEERLHRMYARLALMSEDEVTAVRIVVRELLLSSKRMDRIIERVARGHLPLVLAAVADGLASGQVSDRHDPIVITIATMALGLAPQVGRRVIGLRAPTGFAPPSGEELARQLAAV